MQRFEISVGEPWDFEGPDGPNRIVVDFAGFVNGPSPPNWQSRCLLLKVVVPFTHAGEIVSYLVAAPRYEGDTPESMVANGGTVGVSRVRPAVQLSSGAKFSPADVEYIIIGGLSPTAIMPNKTDAGNGSDGICRVIDASRSPSPDPGR